MIALPLVLAMAAADPPQLSTCFKDGQELQGEMRWVETKNVGNKSDLRFPFLVLSKLSCFDTDDGRVFGRWVQLGLPRDAMKQLTPGYTLTVKAKLMAPVSAYHIGDVLAMDAVIVSQSPP